MRSGKRANRKTPMRWAAEIDDGERDIWLVMMAYQE